MDGYDSDPKVVSSAWLGRGSAVSYPVHSAPPRKKSRASELPDVVCLDDSDTSKAASVATTRSAQSVRGIGLAASAEDQCFGLDARRNVPDHFVHRSMAAAVVDMPLRRRELHPPNPFIAKRQVRRSDLLHVMYLCIGAFMYSCFHVFMYSCIHAFMYSCIHVFMYSCSHVFLYSCIYVFMYSRRHVGMYSCMMY